MDPKLIDTILPKLMELLKTMKVPTEICDKIETLIKDNQSSDVSQEETLEGEEKKDTKEDTKEGEKEDASESECCTCPKCGYEMTSEDMKPKPMGKKAVAVDVTVIKDKKNPLRDLMSRTGF